LPLFAWRLRRLILRWKIDVLHLHAARAGLVGCLASHGLRIGIVYTGHGWRFSQLGLISRRWIIRIIEKYICKHAAVATFIRAFDRKVGINLGLIDHDKAITVNTRIEAPRFKKFEAQEILAARRGLGIPEHSPLVGMVGRLVEEKDPVFFVRVAAKVYESMPDAYFIWVGDGNLRADVEKAARELSIRDHIIITGVRPPKDVPLMIHTMEVFLNTSRCDVTPLCILEAQASRKPVISSAYVGIEDLIEHKVNGLIYPIGNTDEAQKYVIMLLRHPEVAHSIAEEAYRRFLYEHSDPRLMVRQYEDIYVKVENQSRLQ
jgi:glycosyltransferase involved in cell wall biosynthesis